MQKNLYQKYEMLFVALFVGALLAVVFFAIKHALGGVLDGFADTDTYMRALRIRDLMQDFSWAEVPFAQSNYPFGEVLHWTRPMDLLWLSLAYPLSLFMNIKDAIFYSGYMFSPLLNVLSCLVIIWGLRPYCNQYLRFLAVLLFLLQVALVGVYAYARPDHHSLLAFLSLGMIACYLRYFANGNRVLVLLAGIAGGMMIWVAAEGLLFTYITLAVLALLWLCNLVSLKSLEDFTGAVFAMVLFAWVVNPPLEGYLFADNGRLSIMTVVITLFTFCSFYILGRLYQKGLLNTLLKQIVYLGSFALLSVFITLQIFGIGTVFSSPVAEEIQAIWLFRVIEMYGIEFDSILFWADCFLSLVAIVISVFLLVFRMIPEKLIRGFVFIFIPLIIYTVLTFIRARFAPYASTFAVFVIVFVLHIWLDRAGLYQKVSRKYHSLRPFIRMALVSGGLIVAFIYSFVILFVVLSEFNDSVASKIEKTLFMSALVGGEGAVLADTFSGPEIMWKADRPVVGTPYHRNVEGIRDTHDMLFATDDERLKELIVKHKITEIVFSAMVDLTYFVINDFNKDKLYYRMIKGRNLPCWLEEDKWISREDGFVIFHVREDKFNCLY